MSSYLLNKLLRDVNRNPAVREEFFKDKSSVVTRYGLEGAEARAVVDLDIGTLYRMGVHGLILRPFTILQKVSEPDYLKAIRQQ